MDRWVDGWVLEEWELRLSQASKAVTWPVAISLLGLVGGWMGAGRMGIKTKPGQLGWGWGQA